MAANYQKNHHFSALKLSRSLTLAAILFAASGQASLEAEEETAQINLRDVEIPTLVETVSRITGKSFIVDPRVKGRVTVITSKDISEDELYETFLSILQVHGFSAVPSGKLIKIIPSNQAKQQPVPVVGEVDSAGDTTGARTQLQSNISAKRDADELITRVIRVEHVPAAMLVPILRPLVPSTGQLQAYGPSNTIVISDTAANIERLLEVIKRMDRADDEEIEVVKLRYASAKNLAQTIQKLQSSTIKGVPGKNKISADVRTNSLLLSGEKSARQQVRKIIRQLDTPQQVEEKTKVVYLRYAKAEELAKVLTGFSKTQKSSKPDEKGAAGTQQAEVDIQADAASNSLIITAEIDVQRNLEKVIKRLDVRRAQVLVEAVVAEVSADLSKRLASSLAVNSDEGVVGASGTTVGTGTLLGLLNDIIPGSVNGAALGLIDSIGKNKFGLLVEALTGDGATNILSTPTLVAMDNEEASIVIGQNVPFLTGQYSNTGTTTTPSNPFQTIERKDIGLTLKIKPQINEGSSINLQIEQEVSSLAASNTSASDLITNKRSITTNVMVEDGQVLILGGLMEDRFTDSVTKVPGLGNLPVLGNLFRSTTTTKVKQNLMVFIHPVIMRDVLSADNYTRQKYSKLKREQSRSRIDNRGTLKDKAKPFPDELRQSLVEKHQPAKQVARKPATHGKMSQQLNAAQQSRFNHRQSAAQMPGSKQNGTLSQPVNRAATKPGSVNQQQKRQERVQDQVDSFLNSIN